MIRCIDARETALAIAVGCVFTALFIYLTVPVTDPDFWWHLASGKWIHEHRALMDSDPFTIDSPFKQESASRYFVLKQYWLSQIIFYATYAAAGLKGIMLLTATVIVLMFMVMFHLVKRTGIHTAVALILLYLAVMVIVEEFGYIGARPQMWSSLFSVVVVWLMEELKSRKAWSYGALPLLMLVWGNMHGGFILGDVIIFCYMVGSFVSRTASRPFYIVSLLAVLASGLNPNGFSVLTSAPLLGPILSLMHIPGIDSSREAVDSISEAKSIFQHTSLIGIVRGLPYFTSVFLLSLVSFVVCFAKAGSIKTEYLLLYLLVLIMAFRSIRFIIFFTTIASFITAMNLKGIIDNLLPSWLRMSRVSGISATLVVALLISVRLGMAGIRHTDLFSETSFEGVYKQSADFVSTNRINGYIFNDYNAGGYLLWRLASTNRIFVDGRVLYGDLFNIFRSTVDNPFDITPENIFNYRRTMDFFVIDIVMMPGCDAVSGTLIKLVPALLDDPDWSLVYVDHNALVFVRKTLKNSGVIRRFSPSKREAFQHIYNMALGSSKSGHAALMVNWKLSAAYALEGVNEHAKALKLLDEYLAKIPNDSFAASLREKISLKFALQSNQR